MKKTLIVIFALVQLATLASATEPTRLDAKSAFTLLRNSVLSESLRIHVATFDSKDGFGYNKQNCEVAKKLFQKQQGVRVKYWCENGYFGGASKEDQATSKSTPSIVYRYDSRANIIGVNGIVDIEKPSTEPFGACSQRIADIKVDEVVYDNASDIIAGFRATKPTPNEWYGIFRLDSDALYKSIPNAERSNVQKLIRKGAELIAVYQVCGNGGIVTVRDIFAKSAINNP